MAILDKAKSERPEAIDIWNKLNVLANASIPDRSGKYALTRSFDLMQPAIKPLLKERELIDKKLFKRDEKTGEYIEKRTQSGKILNELKDEFIFEDYEKEIENFNNGDPIEFEVYKIKLSSLDTATITNMKTGIPSPIPPSIISALYKTHIIDDFKETEDKSEVKPDMPDIPRKK